MGHIGIHRISLRLPCDRRRTSVLILRINYGIASCLEGNIPIGCQCSKWLCSAWKRLVVKLPRGKPLSMSPLTKVITIAIIILSSAHGVAKETTRVYNHACIRPKCHNFRPFWWLPVFWLFPQRLDFKTHYRRWMILQYCWCRNLLAWMSPLVRNSPMAHNSYWRPVKATDSRRSNPKFVVHVVGTWRIEFK